MELLLDGGFHIHLELVDTLLNEKLVNGKFARECACKACKSHYADTCGGEERTAHNSGNEEERGCKPGGKTCKAAQKCTLDACFPETDEQTADAACADNRTDDAVCNAAVSVML